MTETRQYTPRPPRPTIPPSFQVAVNGALPATALGRANAVDASDWGALAWALPKLGPTSCIALNRMIAANGCWIITEEFAWTIGVSPSVLASSLSRLVLFNALKFTHDPVTGDRAVPSRWVIPMKDSMLESAPAWWRDAYVERMK